MQPHLWRFAGGEPDSMKESDRYVQRRVVERQGKRLALVWVEHLYFGYVVDGWGGRGPREKVGVVRGGRSSRDNFRLSKRAERGHLVELCARRLCALWQRIKWEWESSGGVKWTADVFSFSLVKDKTTGYASWTIIASNTSIIKQWFREWSLKWYHYGYVK